MEIVIDYNGAVAECRIEKIDEPGKMVNFNEADTKSQAYALGAFMLVRQQLARERQLKQYKNHPVMHIRQEFQVTMLNYDKIVKLSREGVILTWSYDVSRDPALKVTLRDGHTIIGTNGWLMQDTEGRWWGMDDGYHCKLEEYQKIVIEPQEVEDIKAKRIEDCDISVRTRSICKANGIETLGDLCKLHKTDWIKFRNGGKKSLAEIDDLLHDYGLDWAEWRKEEN